VHLRNKCTIARDIYKKDVRDLTDTEHSRLPRFIAMALLDNEDAEG
jgi:hypothetical protein